MELRCVYQAGAAWCSLEGILVDGGSPVWCQEEWGAQASQESPGWAPKELQEKNATLGERSPFSPAPHLKLKA